MAESTLDNDAVSAIARLTREGTNVQQVTIAGREFTDRELRRVPLDADLPKPLPFYTLAAFADYVRSDEAAKDVLIHVVSPTRVEAVGKLEGADKHLRRVLAIAECQVGAPLGFRFNDAVSMEVLSIALQTCFAPDRGDIDNLRKFCASVKSTSELGVADDGVSQEVQARRGVAAVQATPVKNPWQLAPWRTFAEVEQPLSPFVLRFIRGEEDEQPAGGLFETGNAQWKPEAVATIAKWLRNGLTDWKVLG